MQTSRAAAAVRLIAVATAVLWGSLAVVAAQGTTGSISGLVTDSSKGALPGATVTVKDVDTGQTRVLTTDVEGRYRADALAPGDYSVTVERPASARRVREIAMSVGQAAALNVRDEHRRHDGEGRRHRGSDARHRPRSRRSPRSSIRADPRAAAQRPRLQPADAAAAGRDGIAEHVAAGRSRHGHAGVDCRRAAQPDQLSARWHRREHPGQRIARAAPRADCSASKRSASSRCSSTTTAPSTAAAPAAS